MDGKFSFTKVRSEGRGGCQKVSYYKYLVVKVLTGAAITIPKTTVDENGKFSYYSSELRPVPPGWYDIDKTKHRVPLGWYQMSSSCPK